MSGIGGWLDYQLNMRDRESELQQMQNSLLEQTSSIFINEHIGMVRCDYRDSEHTICFHGRLTNRLEIKEELENIGYICAFDTDAQIVLQAYLAWGVECFEKLNGVFAIAIYDEFTEELLLARDCFGVMPLYYYEYVDGIVFGSLIKTVLASNIVKPIITKEGLSQLFLLGPGKIPGSGVFKDVFEILPGQYKKFNKDKSVQEFYYVLQAKEHKETLKETIEHVRNLVYECVNSQLDKEYGTMLSGGLDSSIVSKIASQHCDVLDTFYVRYLDNEKYFKKTEFQPNQDEDYIQLMVDDMQSRLYTITLNEKQLLDCLYDAMKARDLPGMADIDSSFYVFCKRIGEYQKVLLSGECADEIFGGYPWYYKEEYVNKNGFPWMGSIEERKCLLVDDVLTDEESFVDKLYRGTIDKVSYLPTDSIEQRRHRELFYLNIYWFMQTLLDRANRISVANDLEVRVPFCDKRLVEYCYNIPVEMKFLNNQEKGLLKEAMKDILPSEIVNRKKSPFPKIWNPKYCEMLIKKMKEILTEDTIFTYLINKEGIEYLMENDIDSLWYGQLMRKPQVLAYLIQMDMWFKEYNVMIEY